jgi:hypothetical protein
MTNSLAPIALFVYKRPWHTRQAVDALKQNDLAAGSDLFIFSDGPRDDLDRAAVAEVREYIRTISGFKKVIRVEREMNLGLARSIISGVTQLTNEYGRVIVLEDDLVTSRYFLKFMNESLERYKETPRVMHISGYMYPVKDAGLLPESFFYRETHSWGWGTWKRAWDAFEPDARKLVRSIKARGLEREFDIRSPRFFSIMLKYQISGHVDSWMIRWYASVFLQNGLSLYSARSLVNNIGNDGSGTHTGTTRQFDGVVADSPVRLFPEAIEESNEALRIMMDFHRSLNRSAWKRMVWLWTRRIKKIGKILRVQKTET